MRWERRDFDAVYYMGVHCGGIPLLPGYSSTEVGSIYFLNVIYKHDSDNDDDTQSTAPAPTTSAAPEPAAADAAATEADSFEVCLVGWHYVRTSLLRKRSLLWELCKPGGYCRRCFFC